MILRSKWILQWSLSGVLLGVGFVFPYLWILGLFGAAYFLFLLTDTKSLKRSLLGGLLAWTIKSSFAVGWFWSTYPIDWMSVDFGNIQLVLILFYWLTASLWLGFGGLAMVLLYRMVARFVSPTTICMYLLLPFLWVASELLGAFSFSVFTYGPGGSLNSSFSFGWGGYLLAEHDGLLQFAALVGVYGLSWLFGALAATMLFVFIAKRRFKLAAVSICGFLYATSFGSLFLSAEPALIDEIKVVTIETTVDGSMYRTDEGQAEIRRILDEAMSEALSKEPDYLLLPEDARFFDQQKSVASLKSRFQNTYSKPKTIVIDSGRVESYAGPVLQAFVYNGQDNAIERVQKRYLVPQGEFVPYLYSSLLRVAGRGSVVDKIEADVSYRVGQFTDQSILSPQIPGILFCFESVSPQGVRTLLKERPKVPFIAHPISHAWFNEPQIFWHQLDAMLKVQAVWNKQYIVSAGNHMEGKVFTPSGDTKELMTVTEGDRWMVKQVALPNVNQ